MRILVYPHAMEIGGSQLNAVQLAGAVRDLGHEVLVISQSGPLVERVRDLGLEHVQLAANRRRPSPVTAVQLTKLAQQRQIDLVHGYEWPPVIEACFGPWLARRTAVVGTVLSMSVVPFFPRHFPLIVGSELIRDAAVSAGHTQAIVIEPPVDSRLDHPSNDGSKFRARYAVPEDEVLVVMVCRLVSDLKLEGLLAACDAIGELARSGSPVRLAIVGDGAARSSVAERACRANRLAGREVVSLTGELADPRPAYAAADVIVGQGGSALRGMSFQKPLVVVGERGFSELLAPHTAPLFLRQGFYGLGAGSRGVGAPALRASLESLVSSPDRRRELGAFSRKLAVERFDVRRAARRLESEYARAIAEPVARSAAGPDLFLCAIGVLTSKTKRRYHRWRGSVAVDDANARPVVEEAPPARTAAGNARVTPRIAPGRGITR